MQFPCDILRKQVAELESRANFLQNKRQCIPTGRTDINDMMRAAKAIILEPNYFAGKLYLMKKYCDRYALNPENLLTVLKLEDIRRKKEQANQRRLTALIMHSKGKTNADIARTVKLSPARVSQIIAAHKKTTV